MGILFQILVVVFSLSPLAFLEAIEYQAVMEKAEKSFQYEVKIMDNALLKEVEAMDDFMRRLNVIEDNQEKRLSCARQDAPIDPNSYALWDNSRGGCKTVTRACVNAPVNPIESRELVFIFDASSSMKTTYRPPRVKNSCKHYYDRYQDECGSKYYPSFRVPHPANKKCGTYSTSKYCQWCGYRPYAPRKRIITGVKLNGEGLPYNVYGYVNITEGPNWDRYITRKTKYEKCNQQNKATQCVVRYNTCKAQATVEFAKQIKQWQSEYNIWKIEVYTPYRTCRYEQYGLYRQCVRDFDAIWNTAKNEPRIEAAKKAVSQAIKSAPSFVDLGLVVFNGCKNIVNHGFYLGADRADLLKAVSSIDATGTTPLVDSMIIAADNMRIKEQGVNAEGYIVLVTDGEDTCVSKNSRVSMKAVCDTAKALKKANNGLVINVLDLSNNSKLSCISEFTGGVYASVSSEGSMLTAIVSEMSKISDVPEYCYAPPDMKFAP